MVHAEAILDVDRSGGKGVVRRRGRADDEIDVGRRHAGATEGRARGHFAERSRCFALAGNMALADAGPLDDPVIAGFDHTFQITVFHDALGEMSPETTYN